MSTNFKIMNYDFFLNVGRNQIVSDEWNQKKRPVKIGEKKSWKFEFIVSEMVVEFNEQDSLGNKIDIIITMCKINGKTTVNRPSNYVCLLLHHNSKLNFRLGGPYWCS